MSKIITKAVKFNSTFNEKANGKFYLHAVHTERVTFAKLIQHIANHGTTYDRGTISGVLYQMVDCIKELVLDSKKVDLGDMGYFEVSISSKGQTEAKDCTAATITNVFLRFRPSRTMSSPLDSKSIRRLAEFANLEEQYVPGNTDGTAENGGSDGTGGTPGGDNGGSTGGGGTLNPD